MFSSIIKILFRFKPERVHHFTMDFLYVLSFVPFIFGIVRKWSGIPNDKEDEFQLGDLIFRNKLGIAAGFDKDAKYLRVWNALGLGFVEVGTITPKPQDGNPKPRLFRLIEDQALINRMGFNNKGMVKMRERLKNRPKGLIVGGNIGKNKITPNEQASNDYQLCFDALYDYVDYFVINVSSPNTPGLRNLQSSKELESIVKPILKTRETLVEQGKFRLPIFVKFAPDLTDEQLKEVIEFVNQSEIDGVVLTNTTIDRSGLKTSDSKVESIGAGGLSGKPVFEKSNIILKKAKEILNEDKVVIGVGGIFSGQDAKDKMNSGADLVQIFTGFIYKGPSLIGDILKSIK